MSSHKCNNGSGRKRNGKAEKNHAKGMQALAKHPKQSQVFYEPSISIIESTSSTSANEEMHSTSDSPVQLNANQLRQLRKINRRRVISNAEIALRRIQLRDTGNQNLTVNELVELLEPEHEPTAAPAAMPPDAINIAPPDDTSPSIIIQNAFQKMGDWRSYTLEVMDEACIPGGCWSITLGKVENYLTGRSQALKFGAVLPPNSSPLTTAGIAKLFTKMEAIRAFLDLLSFSYNCDQRLQITKVSEKLAFGRAYSAQTVRDWTLDFLKHEGICRGLTFKRHTPYTLIHDEGVRLELTQWLLVATKATPTCYARDFMNYLHSKYAVTIKIGMTLQWIKSLGFTFRASTSLELYRDGHERDDVVLARAKFVNTILGDIFPYMTKYTGDDMDQEVEGSTLLESSMATEIVLVVHDEVCFECHDCVLKRYCKDGHGTPKCKNRGASRMLSAYATIKNTHTHTHYGNKHN